MKSTRYLRIFTYLFFVVFAFLCMWYISRNSPLFGFDPYPDTHCFITTARCMLRGDVMYRDVYEHHGLYLFFIYMLGLVATPNSFVGIYVVESIAFSVFIIFAYKIISIFCKKNRLSFVLTLIVALAASTSSTFVPSGQAEFFSLPFATISVYYVIRYFEISTNRVGNNTPDDARPIPAYMIFIIAICFSCIFWMKYTATGMYIGLVIYIVIHCIVNKQAKYIFRYMLTFLLGMIIGSLPVIIYFGVNGAFADLYQVYFYNMIFVYGGSDEYAKYIVPWSTMLWHYLTTSGYILAIPICLIINLFKKRRIPSALPICVMFLFGICFTKLSYDWSYCRGYLLAFMPVGMAYIYLTVSENIDAIKRFLSNIREKIADINIPFFTSKKKLSVGLCIFSLIVIITIAFLVFYILLTPLLLLFAILPLIYVIKYICDNYDRIKQALLSFTKKNRDDFIKHSKLISVLVLVIIVVISYMYLDSNTPHYHEAHFESGPHEIELMGEYINNRTNNPVIIVYDQLDPGLYYVTGTYPPTKYFCAYNIKLDEIDAMYDYYIGDQQADYIYADKHEEFEGYRIVEGFEDSYCTIFEKID